MSIRHKVVFERADWLAGVAAAAFVLPVAVQAVPEWETSPARRPSPLTPALVDALREQVPDGDVVFSDPETSYRIAASAPVYVASAPPGHVADTEDNRPYERRDEARRFFRTGDLSIPREAGAGWIVVDRERFDVSPPLEAVHRDDRFTLYALP